jgi:hypothetical protein
MMPSAMVESSHTGEPERKNGRTATNSTMRPMTAATTTVTRSDGTSGHPAPTWAA